MWNNEKEILAVVTSQLRSNWMEAIKSSSSPQTTSIAKFHRSSPSINRTNSDDDDYAILPPSPPVNRTLYSKVKGKARSRSSSRARVVPLSDTQESSSMIHDEQGNIYHHSGREFSSFDCYQIENRKMNFRNGISANGRENSDGERESNVIRRNRENIYEILTSKRLKDTQKTIKSLNITETNGDAGSLIKLDDQSLSNDQIIEREWNKLVNGSTGKTNAIKNTINTATSNHRSNNNNNNNCGKKSITNSTTTPTSNTNGTNNGSGTRFKEILKLYENLGKSMIDDDKPARKDNEVSRLKSTILQLDNVCQSRLKGIEECHKRIRELRDEIKVKDEANKCLQEEKNDLSGQLDEARLAWKTEREERSKDAGKFKDTTIKLMNRLKELNKELQESHINYDYLEMAYNRLKKDVKGIQELHEAELNLMKERLNDLTGKLSSSERNLKLAKNHIGKIEARHEAKRRNSMKDKDFTCLSKDFQLKLQELEHKIARIQVILLANEHQSPDEGLPDIESNSLPISLNDQPIIQTTIQSGPDSNQNGMDLLKIH